MKKSILSLLLGFLVVGGLSAQTKEFYKDNKHEIRVSIGSINDDYYHYVYKWSYFPSLAQEAYDMNSFYMDDKKTTGAYSISYFYHPQLLNGRFSVGGALSFSYFKQNYRDNITDANVGNNHEYNIAITPTVRYAWVAKPSFQFYSGIGLSVYMNEFKNKVDVKGFSEHYSDNRVDINLVVVPIGFSVGKKIFAFGELNIGGRAGVAVGGVGYRF